MVALGGDRPSHGPVAAAELPGRPCVVLESNARGRVLESGNAFYPDGAVVCDAMERDAEDALSLTNPAVLIEVLSPSTAEYARTDRLADHQRIPGLRHIVHVSHQEPRIGVWTRDAARWQLRDPLGSPSRGSATR